MSLQTNNSLEVESVCLMKIKERLYPHVAEFVLPLKAEKTMTMTASFRVSMEAFQDHKEARHYEIMIL